MFSASEKWFGLMIGSGLKNQQKSHYLQYLVAIYMIEWE